MHLLIYLWAYQEISKMIKYDLSFPQITTQSTKIPWDLEIFLYKGASSIDRKVVIEAIRRGDFGTVETKRIPLVFAFHEALTCFIVKGKTRITVINNLLILRDFYAWADTHSEEMTVESVVNSFCLWTECLLERVHIKQKMAERTAYSMATKMSNLIARALKLEGMKPGRNVLRLTRITRPEDKKEILGIQNDKDNVKKLFEFGNILTAICSSLDVNTIRGELPIYISAPNNIVIQVAGSLLKPNLDLSTITDENLLRAATRSRRAMLDSEHVFEKNARFPILKLRVECELLIFIAQTGMNLSQAEQIDKSNYRWQTNGEDFDVFRVYKNRRQGDALFCCFKAYRNHFNTYLSWLEDTGLSDHDNRLFPFFGRSMGDKGGKSAARFQSTRVVFKKIGKTFYSPKTLRSNRVNWILRYTQDSKLTANMVAHDESTLLRHYEKPDYQSAATEIIQFHSNNQQAYSSPGPGVCIAERQPVTINNFSTNSPDPDCISSDGCLFCDKHRDIMNMDYCWKLSSYAYLKKLELNTLYSSVDREKDPNYRVLERIMKKLESISKENKNQLKWVEQANDSVRAGTFHPYWDGHIRLMEIVI